MQRRLAVLLFVVAACGGKKEDAPAPAPAPLAAKSVEPGVTAVPAPTPKPPVLESPEPVKVDKAPTPAPPPTVPEGNPPPDGKYERVIVEGVTVPMIQVMEHGTVVLVDTDGKKPRTWEEQYKRKKITTKGQFDVHKTDANKNNKFDDDAIDKEGLWVIDDKGNLTKH